MTDAPLQNIGNERLQRWLLRLAALIQFTALPGIILPRQAIEKVSWLMGFGQPPKLPLLFYAAGGCAYVCVAEAVVLWMISLDVVKYRPLVVVNAWIFLAAAPGFLWIDTQSGLPAWWVAMDSLTCLAFGVALQWACYGFRRTR